MGHRCCSKQKVKRGLWSPEEDEKLITHIATYGHGSWSSVPKLAGLQRCGKSCRLRWINYLKPDLKKGSFTQEEEQIIIDVHRILGNRWAQIAKHLPGRTDNEVKNFWNSCIKKKLISQGLDPQTHNLFSSSSHPRQLSNKKASTTFVVSHENQKQPISAFSMNSMAHEKTSYIPPSLISPPYNILQPTEIPTVDQYKDPILGIANGRNSATWTVIDQINYPSQEMQYYYGSSSMENSTPNVSSSSSSSVDIHQQYQTKSGNLLNELGIWDSSFQPFEAPKTISEAEYQKSPQGQVNNEHQQLQLLLQENDEKIWENHNDQTFENYSFGHAFTESALMSEALMCNDLSSVQYDHAWNYYQA